MGEATTNIRNSIGRCENPFRKNSFNANVKGFIIIDCVQELVTSCIPGKFHIEPDNH